MSDRLPPLPALLAFEAAARLGGFQQAAGELHLTPSAISHRIRQLEADLGRSLFERRHRGVGLTAEGSRYYATVRDALQRIADASEALRAAQRKTLRLSAAPALGSKWLVGRLTRFQEAHPEIDFSLSTGTGLAPLLAGEADLGLRYGDEEWPGLDAWKLFDETIVAVCSPAYAARLPRRDSLLEARGLRHPLLSWEAWATACGCPAPGTPGARFDDALLMLEAAVAGQGVALITATLAAPYLAAGTLCQPVAAACPGQGFYVVAPRSAQEKPWVRDFIRWLVRDAHQSLA